MPNVQKTTTFDFFDQGIYVAAIDRGASAAQARGVVLSVVNGSVAVDHNVTAESIGIGGLQTAKLERVTVASLVGRKRFVCALACGIGIYRIGKPFGVAVHICI
jgi:hypothetical protein